VDFIAAQNIDVNAIDIDDGCTVLHKAAIHGYTEVVAVLITAQNIDVNADCGQAPQWFSR
jgi:hypothetical protein